MKIDSLVKTPELIEMHLDDEDIVASYGEPVVFYTWDIVNMNVYFEFFNARTNGEIEALSKLIKTLILDEKGNPVLQEGRDLPIDIMTAAIVKVGDMLGKSQSKKSTPKVGKVRTS